MAHCPAGFAPVPGLEHIAVNRDGKAMSFRNNQWRPLAVKFGGRGRPSARIESRGRKHSLAALVLRTWVGPSPWGFESFQFPDPDPANCRVENLKWAPRGTRRSIEEKGFVTGSRVRTAKLDEHRVVEMRRRYESGEAQAALAIRFDVSPWTVQLIVTGKSWRLAGGPIVKSPLGRRAILPAEGATKNPPDGG